ncbi:MAG: hypothetical protein Q9195_004199 [Heterodermia aff. obscurata]
MEIFTQITSEPAFAVGVKELVYDARLFWGFFAGKQAHYQAIAARIDQMRESDEDSRSASEGSIAAVDDGSSASWEDELESDEEFLSLSENSPTAVDSGSPASDNERSSLMAMAERERSYNRYVELFQQQSDILDSGADYLALCRGMQHLPSLKTVSIQGVFGSGSDFDHLHDPLPPQYITWSSGFYQDTFGPATEFECRMTRRDILTEHWTEASANAFEDHPWDWRGVKNCLKSLAMRRSSITHLHYRGQKSSLPTETLEDSGVSKSLESFAHELTCLKLDCGSACSESGMDSSHDNSKAMAILVSILGGARQLTTLSASFSSGRLGHTSIYPPFGHLTWPKLRTLELGEWKMDLAFLKSICRRHQGTLRELKLRWVMLLSRDGFGENEHCTWDDVGREVGPILQLSDLSLAALYYESVHGNCYLGSLTKSLGLQLMSSVPEKSLRLTANQVLNPVGTSFSELDEIDDPAGYLDVVEMWHETETLHEDRYRRAKDMCGIGYSTTYY